MRKSILLWAGLFSFIGCSSPPSLGVSLSNESGEAIYQVRLQAGGNTFDKSQLSAGMKTSGRMEVALDSAVEVTYRMSPDSEATHCQGDVYVAAGVRQTLNVVVGKDGCTFSVE
ncbi:hypothetical protein [Stenotrophomonas sepilia]|uniref:hypothetical protein n=1 Tax=Stenotrophomonas sepilia TaxID=2860290 RepID=UPI00333FFDF5